MAMEGTGGEYGMSSADEMYGSQDEQDTHGHGHGHGMLDHRQYKFSLRKLLRFGNNQGSGGVPGQGQGGMVSRSATHGGREDLPMNGGWRKGPYEEGLPADAPLAHHPSNELVAIAARARRMRSVTPVAYPGPLAQHPGPKGAAPGAPEEGQLYGPSFSDPSRARQVLQPINIPESPALSGHSELRALNGSSSWSSKDSSSTHHNQNSSSTHHNQNHNNSHNSYARAGRPGPGPERDAADRQGFGGPPPSPGAAYPGESMGPLSLSLGHAYTTSAPGIPQVGAYQRAPGGINRQPQQQQQARGGRYAEGAPQGYQGALEGMEMKHSNSAGDTHQHGAWAPGAGAQRVQLRAAELAPLIPVVNRSSSLQETWHAAGARPGSAPASRGGIQPGIPGDGMGGASQGRVVPHWQAQLSDMDSAAGRPSTAGSGRPVVVPALQAKGTGGGSHSQGRGGMNDIQWEQAGFLADQGLERSFGGLAVSNEEARRSRSRGSGRMEQGGGEGEDGGTMGFGSFKASSRAFVQSPGKGSPGKLAPGEAGGGTADARSMLRTWSQENDGGSAPVHPSQRTAQTPAQAQGLLEGTTSRGRTRGSRGEGGVMEGPREPRDSRAAGEGGRPQELLMPNAGMQGMVGSQASQASQASHVHAQRGSDPQWRARQEAARGPQPSSPYPEGGASGRGGVPQEREVPSHAWGEMAEQEGRGGSSGRPSIPAPAHLGQPSHRPQLGLGWSVQAGGVGLAVNGMGGAGGSLAHRSESSSARSSGGTALQESGSVGGGMGAPAALPAKRGAETSEGRESQVGARDSSWGGAGEGEPDEEEAALLGLRVEELLGGEQLEGVEQDVEYVRHVLLLSGFASSRRTPPLHALDLPMFPLLFESLEESIGSGVPGALTGSHGGYAASIQGLSSTESSSRGSDTEDGRPGLLSLPSPTTPPYPKLHHHYSLGRASFQVSEGGDGKEGAQSGSEGGEGEGKGAALHKPLREELRQRMLLFDAVNEALGRRLRPFLPQEPWMRALAPPLVRLRPTGKQLLHEVWTEIHDWPVTASDEVYDILDDAARRDMAGGVDKWQDTSGEAVEVVFELEASLMEDLFAQVINELAATDLAKRRKALARAKAPIVPPTTIAASHPPPEPAAKGPAPRSFSPGRLMRPDFLLGAADSLRREGSGGGGLRREGSGGMSQRGKRWIGKMTGL